MSDVQLDKEVTVKPDFLGDYERALEIINNIWAVASERTQGGYTLQYLDLGRFPKEYYEPFSQPKPAAELSPSDAEAAQKAAVVLAVEAAFQILEAKARNNQAIERLESLEKVVKMAAQSAGYAMMLEAKHPDFLAEAAMSALQRRDQLSSQAEISKEQKEQREQFVNYSKNALTKAAQLTYKQFNLLQGYFGR